jgi:hypothetical protein
MTTQCLANHGFCAEPNNTLQQNFNNTLKILEKAPQYLQPTNLAFHNLCKQSKLPTGSRVLLAGRQCSVPANGAYINFFPKQMWYSTVRLI